MTNIVECVRSVDLATIAVVFTIQSQLEAYLFIPLAFAFTLAITLFIPLALALALAFTLTLFIPLALAFTLYIHENNKNRFRCVRLPVAITGF